MADLFFEFTNYQKEEDLRKFIEIQNDVADYVTYNIGFVKNERAALARFCYSSILFIKKNNETIGSIEYHKYFDAIYIIGFAIKKQFQGLGLGYGALTTFIFSFFENENCFILDVHKHNNKAIGLYRKIGFEIFEKKSDILKMSMQKI